MSVMIKTKIVCTIGPASNSYEKIEKLIQEGMDVARLNFSHGNYLEHHQVIENIRRATLKTNESVAILQDLGGPKIRIGKIEREPIFLKEGSLDKQQVIDMNTEGTLNEILKELKIMNLHLEIVTDNHITSQEVE